MEQILARARPEIRALRPYASARSEGLDGAVLLNANENPWDEAGEAGTGALNRYPEPQPAALVARLAELYGVAADELLIGRGSDEAIDLLVRAFCRAYADSVVVTPPTFGMYALCAQIQGAAVKAVALDGDFALDTAGVCAALDDSVKLVFLCTPGNPGGRCLDEAAVEAVLRACAGRALVVVDEAYGEFSGRASWAARLSEFPNLVVLRTLSKLYGLAGARIGVLLAQAPIVDLLKRILAPYPVPAPVAERVLAAVAPEKLAARAAQCRLILSERARLAQALGSLPWVRRVYASDANFLLLACDQAEPVLAACRAAGIRIRDRRADVANAVRISVGTPEENTLLLEVLSRVSR